MSKREDLKKTIADLERLIPSLESKAKFQAGLGHEMEAKVTAGQITNAKQERLNDEAELITADYQQSVNMLAWRMIQQQLADAKFQAEKSAFRNEYASVISDLISPKDYSTADMYSLESFLDKDKQFSDKHNGVSSLENPEIMAMWANAKSPEAQAELANNPDKLREGQKINDCGDCVGSYCRIKYGQDYGAQKVAGFTNVDKSIVADTEIYVGLRAKELGIQLPKDFSLKKFHSYSKEERQQIKYVMDNPKPEVQRTLDQNKGKEIGQAASIEDSSKYNKPLATFKDWLHESRAYRHEQQAAQSSAPYNPENPQPPFGGKWFGGDNQKSLSSDNKQPSTLQSQRQDGLQSTDAPHFDPNREVYGGKPATIEMAAKSPVLPTTLAIPLVSGSKGASVSQ